MILSLHKFLHACKHEGSFTRRREIRAFRAINAPHLLLEIHQVSLEFLEFLKVLQPPRRIELRQSSLRVQTKHGTFIALHYEPICLSRVN